MKLVWAYFKTGTLQLLRIPAYLVPTMIFPSMFFLFFAVPNAKTTMTANFVMASFATFAVLGVALFQFGVGIAAERDTPWEIFLRTLPVSPIIRFAARILSALAFSALTVCLLIAVALLTTPVRLGVNEWIRFILGLVLGSVPFALFGIAIGYWATPKAALPVANLIYLPLSFAGGLLVPPQNLPDLVAVISPYLPTRKLGEVIWSAVLNQDWQVEHWLWLLGYAIAFGMFAIWGYRRDEGEHYG
jgi:ABC-2 type transport system permease protein